MQDGQVAEYPIALEVDYPNRALNRLSTLFRFVTIIPPALILGLLSGCSNGPFLFLPTALMIVFRRKYPRWWFDWNLNMARFSARVAAYAALLTDEFPSTEREQSVHLEMPYPDAREDLLRGMPLVKWLLAVPHFAVLAVLAAAATVCVVIAWFAILTSGRYPRGLHRFVVATMRYGLRVSAYAFLLVTDRYPPFSLR